MTKKRYHTDAYQTSLSTHVVERTTVNNAPALVLEETIFYPTSGGQPHDTGTLNGIRVLDVQETEEHHILHVLDRPIDQDEVTGQIDWTRRFDHMQQHTGQHLLSQAFIQTCETETLSFHLGDESSTLDISKPDLTNDQIARTEHVANQIIYENRPVLIHWGTQEDIRKFPVRKWPTVDKNVRIIEIRGFDFSPCGGTHCSRTGELGMVKIHKWENYKGGTRIHFLCGGRALRDFQQKSTLLRQLTNMLTTGETELPALISRIQEEAKHLRRELAQNMAQLMDYEAQVLLSERTECGPYLVLTKTFCNRSPKDLKLLANTLLEHTSNTIIVFGSSTHDKASLLFSRSQDVPVDMNTLMKTACSVLNGRGGGPPHQAQGGGTEVGRLDEAMRQALATLNLQVKEL